MRIERGPDGSCTRLELNAPTVLLIFEIEARRPTCIWPRDEAALARIVGDLDERSRDLLLHWLDVELQEEA